MPRSPVRTAVRPEGMLATALRVTGRPPPLDRGEEVLRARSPAGRSLVVSIRRRRSGHATRRAVGGWLPRFPVSRPCGPTGSARSHFDRPIRTDLSIAPASATSALHVRHASRPPPRWSSSSGSSMDTRSARSRRSNPRISTGWSGRSRGTRTWSRRHASSRRISTDDACSGVRARPQHRQIAPPDGPGRKAGRRDPARTRRSPPDTGRRSMRR